MREGGEACVPLYPYFISKAAMFDIDIYDIICIFSDKIARPDNASVAAKIGYASIPQPQLVCFLVHAVCSQNRVVIICYFPVN